jgi:predicted alpha-1,2-mannosidase
MNSLPRFSKLRPQLLAVALLATTVAAPFPTHHAQAAPVDHVNPYIGNISHLLVPTYPTMHLPNGMLRVIPDRGDFTSPRIGGLPLLSTSHRGQSAFSLDPYEGELSGHRQNMRYTYDQEKIKPYLYSVTLEDSDTDVQFAPSYKAGIYRFEYHNEAPHSFTFSSGDGDIKVEGATISSSQNLGNGTKAYVYLVFSAMPQSSGVFDSNAAPLVQTPQPPVVSTSGGGASVFISFPKGRAPLSARYGVSFISVEQAKKNLEREIPNFDLDGVAKKGRTEWNKALGKLDVQGGTEDQQTVFYTSLYRTYERMINISEDGRYFSATDGQVHEDGGVDFYTDDWIWDTYRAAHPLHTLINPKKESAKIASYVRMAQQSREGWMPTFPEVTGDSHRMNGNHAVAVVWDAYSKGLRGFDLAAAYEASKKAIMESTMSPWMRRPAGDVDEFYKEKGYFPALKPGEPETSPVVHGFEKRQSVAVTLAASFDDWCLAQIARQLGKTEDYNYFLARSYNYRNLFNPETSFFHPKDKEGNFIQPFDYKFSGGVGVREYYDENNGWTYRWDVQHNVADLVNLMGGREKFVGNLDQLFAESMGRGKREFYWDLPDQTGNVGQFTMGNEPSLHIPYLYNYAGAPWKTQKRVRSLLEMWFRNDVMGIPGDEDGGGLTSFAVFSSMGFYPVTVGFPVYNIGSPIFNRVSVDLDNGKKFIIDAKNSSQENKYIQSARLNGVVWNKPWFAHSDIAQGGRLELVMGPRPNKSWGAAPGAAPPSAEPKPVGK